MTDEILVEKSTLRRTIEIVGGLLLAPLLGLLFVVFLPLIGFFALIHQLIQGIHKSAKVV